MIQVIQPTTSLSRIIINRFQLNPCKTQQSFSSNSTIYVWKSFGIACIKISHYRTVPEKRLSIHKPSRKFHYVISTRKRRFRKCEVEFPFYFYPFPITILIGENKDGFWCLKNQGQYTQTHIAVLRMKNDFIIF